MGNANGREERVNGGEDAALGRSNGGSAFGANYVSNSHPTGIVASPYSMANCPPQSPRPSGSPLLFTPLIPVNPIQRGGATPFLNQVWQSESQGTVNIPPKQGIPTLITWYYGGNDVAVEGSWDNWRSRKKLQRSGKDHCILLVLPSGIYHYKFIVDGEFKYIPDLPFVADGMGHTCNLLDVHDYVPENLETVAEFEAPASPASSYGHSFLEEADFAKDPLIVPPQLDVTALGMENTDEAATSSSKPRHVVLNHLYIEKGRVSQSVVALGLTHRFQSKYVTVVLYKPLKR